jgi:hypothetical protein
MRQIDKGKLVWLGALMIGAGRFARCRPLPRSSAVPRRHA